MNTVNTYFNSEKRFVLTNNDTTKVIAIIEVEPGENDISEKLIQAIKEDEDLETATIIEGLNIKNVDNYQFCISKTDEINTEEETAVYNLFISPTY